MTTRKSEIETQHNQRSASSDTQRTVLIAKDSRKAEKYHKALAGTLTSCGRTNTEFKAEHPADIPDGYGPCAKCFDLEGGGC